jgi:outer membrane immunogenic protein
MKNILLSSVAALAVTSSAFAADLPARREAPAPYVQAAPIFSWTGFYIGANAGAAFNGKNNGFVSNGFAPAAVPNAYYGTAFGGGDNTRFTGGAQAGFNWQTSNVVWGLETDINFVDRGNTNNIGVPVGAPLPYAVINGNNGGNGNWFGTVRGRLGLAFNRSLFYVTGGFAYGANRNNNQSVTYFSGGCPVAAGGCAFSTTTNDSNIGWTVGGGMEYAFTDTISAKIEYLHVEMGRKNAVFTNAANPGFSFTSRDASKFDVVRAGINFKFGGLSAPSSVVARY